MVARYSDAEVDAGVTALNAVAIRVEFAVAAAITLLAIYPIVAKMYTIYGICREHVRAQQSQTAVAADCVSMRSTVPRVMSRSEAPGARYQTDPSSPGSASSAPAASVWPLWLGHSTVISCLLYLSGYVPLFGFYVVLAALGADGNMNRVGWISLLAGCISVIALGVRARSIRMLVQLFSSLERILLAQPSFTSAAGRAHLKRLQLFAWLVFYFHVVMLVSQGVLISLIGWNWRPSSVGMSRGAERAAAARPRRLSLPHHPQLGGPGAIRVPICARGAGAACRRGGACGGE